MCFPQNSSNETSNFCFGLTSQSVNLNLIIDFYLLWLLLLKTKKRTKWNSFKRIFESQQWKSFCAPMIIKFLTKKNIIAIISILNRRKKKNNYKSVCHKVYVCYFDATTKRKTKLEIVFYLLFFVCFFVSFSLILNCLE